MNPGQIPFGNLETYFRFPVCATSRERDREKNESIQHNYRLHNRINESRSFVSCFSFCLFPTWICAILDLSGDNTFSSFRNLNGAFDGYFFQTSERKLFQSSQIDCKAKQSKTKHLNITHYG